VTANQTTQKNQVLKEGIIPNKTSDFKAVA